MRARPGGPLRERLSSLLRATGERAATVASAASAASASAASAATGAAGGAAAGRQDQGDVLILTPTQPGGTATGRLLVANDGDTALAGLRLVCVGLVADGGRRIEGRALTTAPAALDLRARGHRLVDLTLRVPGKHGTGHLDRGDPGGRVPANPQPRACRGSLSACRTGSARTGSARTGSARHRTRPTCPVRWTAYGQRTREALLARLDGRTPEVLSAALREYPARAGKALRPALVLLTSAALGGSEESGMALAVGVEMLHNAFLVHDDVSDGSRLRRGGPSLPEQVGVGLAVCAGDALAVEAMAVLREAAGPLPSRGRAVLGRGRHGHPAHDRGAGDRTRLGPCGDASM